MSSKSTRINASDAKAEMKEYLETRRKRKFVAFITNEPITLTFQFEDDDLLHPKTLPLLKISDKGLITGRAGVLATITNTSKAVKTDVLAPTGK